jgi:CRISPR/Cas system-associated endonuclease Cas1
MKFLSFTKVIGCVAICASLASADSLQLRNGRHLQGRFIGGTTNAIGFMTAGAVEYFATSDVLVLIFDNNESPLSGLQPSPMKGQSSPQLRIRQISSSARVRARPPQIRATVISTSSRTSIAASDHQKIADRESDLVEHKVLLVDSARTASSLR